MAFLWHIRTFYNYKNQFTKSLSIAKFKAKTELAPSFALVYRLTVNATSDVDWFPFMYKARRVDSRLVLPSWIGPNFYWDEIYACVIAIMIRIIFEYMTAFKASKPPTTSPIQVDCLCVFLF